MDSVGLLVDFDNSAYDGRAGRVPPVRRCKVAPYTAARVRRCMPSLVIASSAMVSSGPMSCRSELLE
jgi:hypothetical protein